jgi:oligopeptide transport system substrate-binding protein
MKRSKLVALVLSVVFALSFALTGCGSKATTDKEQYLNLPILADVRTLDASKATDLYSKDVLNAIYDGLTRVENDGTKDIMAPAGAEKWETSQDGTVWTFHLRDYKWNDGKQVTAKDYVYSWKRLLDPKTA